MSNDHRIEDLEAYLYGRMEPDDARIFLNRLEKNLRMREVLAGYRLPDGAPPEAAARLKVLREKYGGPQPKSWGLLQPRWAVLWGIVGLAIFIAWNIGYGYLNFTDEALARAYYISAKTLPEGAPAVFQRADSLF